MIIAAVYVPPEILDYGHFALEGYEYITHRGYGYAGLYRKWEDVDQVLHDGFASLVVLARSVHGNPDRHWRAESVDETTRPIRWPRFATPIPQNVRERQGTVSWSAGRVRELMDGNGPVPRGLDSDAIAAIRRIARFLANRGYR
jgi:hypothetical protein